MLLPVCAPVPGLLSLLVLVLQDLFYFVIFTVPLTWATCLGPDQHVIFLDGPQTFWAGVHTQDTQCPSLVWDMMLFLQSHTPVRQVTCMFPVHHTCVHPNVIAPQALAVHQPNLVFINTSNQPQLCYATTCVCTNPWVVILVLQD